MLTLTNTQLNGLDFVNEESRGIDLVGAITGFTQGVMEYGPYTWKERETRKGHYSLYRDGVKLHVGSAVNTHNEDDIFPSIFFSINKDCSIFDREMILFLYQDFDKNWKYDFHENYRHFEEDPTGILYPNLSAEDTIDALRTIDANHKNHLNEW